MVVMLLLGLALGFLLNHNTHTALAIFLVALAVEVIADLINALQKR